MLELAGNVVICALAGVGARTIFDEVLRARADRQAMRRSWEEQRQQELREAAHSPAILAAVREMHAREHQAEAHALQRRRRERRDILLGLAPFAFLGGAVLLLRLLEQLGM